MTLIPAKPALKVVPLPILADLSFTSLGAALEIAALYPHDGWGDLIVHQAELGPALTVASASNLRNRLQVRVVTDTTLGRSDWKLKTRGVVVTSLWTNKTE